MFIKLLKNLRRSAWPVFFIMLSLLLLGAGKTSADASNRNGLFVVDDLPAQIKNLLKNELEKEFGPLNDKIIHDKTEIYGRVIGIDFVLPDGKRLDDTWGAKVGEALSRLGITGVNEGDEVRADGQEIAGKMASSMQFTTARGYEDPDVIGFVAMFSGNNRNE
jgi:hypothetical protein